MPFSRQTAFTLGFLLLAVPGQYLISKYTETSESQRSFAIRGLLASIHQFANSYLNPRAWKEWLVQILVRLKENKLIIIGSAPDESPAIEVIKYREKSGFYGSSLEPRSPRPPQIKFRVGQVVKIKGIGYRGVIVGWDAEAKAPTSWLNRIYPIQIMHWAKMSHYSILLDARDSMDSSTLYVVEGKIEAISNTKILHPRLDDFFEKFDGAQYLPRPWLRTIYPHD